jgi:glycosyltransferase involved in cell wall biosynthesis
MRILISHNRYRHAGGEEVQVRLLDEMLRHAGHEVGTYLRDSSELEEPVWAPACAALRMTYDSRARNAFRQLVAAWGPDVVHFHNILPLLTPAALRGAKDAGAAVVMTLHNYRFACPNGTLVRHGRVHADCLTGSPLMCALRNPRGRWSESIVYGVALEIQRRLGLLTRWVDAFVAPSRFLAEAAATAGLPADRIHVVENGVRLPAEAPWSGEYALYTGRLSDEKGLPTLLAAAGKAGVPLRVAGDGPLAGTVGNGDGVVRYLGFLRDEALEHARERAAFVVAPSEWPEVAPLAVIEAAAAGRATIVTAIGGLPEIVEDGQTGIVVPPRNSARLSEAMRFLWSRPEETALLGRNARARAQEVYTVERQVSELLALYQDVRSR